MDEPADPAQRRLEALLNDERARRAHAEQALAAERDRAALWRRRAEERAERIQRLTTPASRLRRGLGLGSTSLPTDRSAASTAQPGPVPPTVSAPAQPAVPTVVAAVDGTSRPLLDGLVAVVDVDERAARAAADLVAVGATRLADAGFREWVELDGRPPLLVVDDDSEPPEAPPGPRDVVVTDRTDVWSGWRSVETGPVVRGLLAVPTAEPPLRADGGRMLDATGRLVGIIDGDGALNTALEAGVPVVTGIPDADATEWLRRATVRTRRRLDAQRPVEVAHRLLAALSVDAPRRKRTVTAVLVSNRPSDVAPALRGIGSQLGVEMEVIVGLHGIPGGDAARRLLDELSLSGEVIEMDGAWPLGRCTNHALERGSGELWAKFDDDDVYGPHHLLDSVVALDATGADLVGKSVAYVHLEAEDRTYLYRQGREDEWGQFVFGATFVGRRDLWDRLRFPHRHARIDSVFLAAARRAGAGIHSTTRDEYMVVRRRQAGHTWGADPEVFRSAATPVWEGLRPERVVVD